MRILSKQCLIWAVLLAVSVQGAAAVMSLRGPAHFHAAAEAARAPAAARKHAAPAYRAHHNHHSAVISALRGAAQLRGVAETAQARVAGDKHAAHRPHPARHSSDHSHDQVRRHYHLPGSEAVWVPDHAHNDTGTAAERASRVEPVGSAFVAVISEALVFTPTDATSSFAIGRAKKLVSCAPSRIERPPRHLSA